MKEKCLRCERPTKGCIPYLMSLTTPELCEWIRMWKDRFGWSNAYFADVSNVPKGTIDRVLGHNDKDVKLVTIRPMICAIVGCTLEELEACEKDSVSIQKLEEEKEMLNQALRNKDKEHKEEIAYFKEQMKTKDKILDERAEYMRRKDRYITFLAIGFTLTLLVIIAALLVDKMNADVGFFWIKDTLSAVFGSETGNNTLQNQIAGWRL